MERLAGLVHLEELDSLERQEILDRQDRLESSDNEVLKVLPDLLELLALKDTQVSLVYNNN